MKEWIVEIVCIVKRHKKIKRYVWVLARTYRDAVKAAARVGGLFGKVRVRAWLAA